MTSSSSQDRPMPSSDSVALGNEVEEQDEDFTEPKEADESNTRAMKNDDNDDDEFATPPIYYFGFGAMVNETSRRRRNVKSRFERPAILHNYQLLFIVPGAATIAPCPGQSVHGILMELSPKSWELTKDFEKGYNVVQQEVYPYDPSDQESKNDSATFAPVVARMFRLDERVEDKVCRPEERYIKIISQGLRQYGVEEDYIQTTIVEGSNFIPSLGPEDFGKCPQQCQELPLVTWDEYQTQCQEKWGFVLGRRIFLFERALLDHDKQHPGHLILQWMEHNAFGQGDSTWKIWNTLLDPDMPECASEEDLTDLHYAWAEHKIVEALTKTKIALPSVTGRLVSNERDEQYAGEGKQE